MGLPERVHHNGSAHFVCFVCQNEQIRCVTREIRLLGIGSAHSAFRSIQSEQIGWVGVSATGFRNVSTASDLLILCPVPSKVSGSDGLGLPERVHHNGSAHFVCFVRQNEQIRCVTREIRLLGIGSAHSAFRSIQSERIGCLGAPATCPPHRICSLWPKYGPE